MTVIPTAHTAAGVRDPHVRDEDTGPAEHRDATDHHATTGDVVTDFARASVRYANRIALVHNGSDITYTELASGVGRTAQRYLAHRRDNGESGTLFGLLVSHQPAVAEHLLAILHSGGGYCPIDAALPAARRQALAGALGIDEVFALDTAPVDRDAGDAYSEDGPGAVDGAMPPTSAVPQVSWAPGDPAYVLCTSGSTGAPKPVVVSRRALAATVGELRRLFALTPDDRVLQFASLGWDTCLEEILPALTSGASLVFDDAAHSGSFVAFMRMLSERGITVLDLPTAFWHELVLFLHEERLALPAGVRLVVIGGERVDPTRLQQWRDLGLGDITLLNTYGCTETTMITHAVQLAGAGTEPAVTDSGAEVPIGRTLPHVLDHVSDEGELLVSGPSLATGYLGLPEVTDRGFPVEDHGSGPRRWFHTGDMVTVGPDRLRYSRGRSDEQVKVLGVRVHPAEVESQLCTHPAVTGAVVVGERSLDRTSLTAYVVRAHEVTASELKHHLRERLPRQFVPSRVVFIPALSYTASGKVNRIGTRDAAEDHLSKENAR